VTWFTKKANVSMKNFVCEEGHCSSARNWMKYQFKMFEYTTLTYHNPQACMITLPYLLPILEIFIKNIFLLSIKLKCYVNFAFFFLWILQNRFLLYEFEKLKFLCSFCLFFLFIYYIYELILKILISFLVHSICTYSISNLEKRFWLKWTSGKNVASMFQSF